ncbi:MAG: MmgE/PrpD family protein, partial [Acidobacteria bacterium]|nr:MmgE/PrpD family protein [Acidobacteriota bacterium]
RTGAISHWKGLAYPNTAFGCMHAALLAMRGITGPPEVFEGNKGFMDSLAGRFELDWSQEDLEAVRRTILKKYNAEIHSQSAIEGLLELQRDYGFRAAEIERIEVDIFDVAHKIIGGGEEGDKRTVRTKEEADHSLPYLLAVALLDGTVMPEGYHEERIGREDVQQLLQRVVIRPAEEFSRRFPAEMPCRFRVRLAGGQVLEREKSDYEGFLTHPMKWKAALEKFERLAEPHVGQALRGEIAEAISRLESIKISELTLLLGVAGAGGLKHARTA